MKQITKLRKKISAWLLCFVMVLATVNLPVCATKVHAAGVKFEDERLVKYLSKYYAFMAIEDESYSEYAAIFEKVEAGYDYRIENKTDEFGQISDEDLAKITKLDFYFDDDLVPGSVFHMNDYRLIDWSELEKFTSLKSLSIKGVDYMVISSIKFPSSLTSLTIENCGMYELDVSNCSGLEECVLKSVSFTGRNDFTIKGLNKYSQTLTALKKLTIKYTNIESIYAPESVTSTGLELIINNCSDLTSVDMGGYQFTKDAYFSECEKLSSITAKASVSGTTQILGILNCAALNNLNLTCSFASESDRYNIKTTGISSSEGTMNVSIAPGSAPGKIKLQAEDGSFIKTQAGENTELFDTGEVVAKEKAAYVLFAPVVDITKYNISIGKGNNYKLNGYEKANSIGLEINEVVSDDSVHFLSKDGEEIYGVPYELTVENLQIPTEISEKEKENYQVIEIDKSNKNKITAKNPGIVRLTATAKDGSGNKDVQIIIVYAPITSASMVEADTHRCYNYFDFDFKITIKSPMPSMLIQSINYGTWLDTKDNLLEKKLVASFERKEADGSWKKVDVFNHVLSSYVIEDGQITLTYKTNMSSLDNYLSGEYRLNTNIIYNSKWHWSSNENLTEVSGYVYVNLKNVYRTADQITYGREIIRNEETNIKNEYSNSASDVVFYIPKSKAEEQVSISIKDKDKYLDCLVLNKVNDDETMYCLEFNDEKTDSEIANMLRSLKQNEVTIEVNIKEAGQDERIYEKTVKLKGYFSVTYDLDGGNIKNSNLSYYPLPYAANYETYYRYKNKNAPTKDGYEFVGWSSGDMCDKDINNILKSETKGNMSLVAQYDLIKDDGGNDNDGNVDDSDKDPELEKPGFEKSKITILIGDKVKSNFANPANKKVTYKTSNKKIVKVDANGKLTAVKKGKATIIATLDGKTYKLTVVVAKPTISGKSSVKVGKKLTLTMKNANSKISWKSSNKKIATVTKSGIVKGVKKGKVTITATYNKKKYKKKITVK